MSKSDRRNFIRNSLGAGMALGLPSQGLQIQKDEHAETNLNNPKILSTWSHGIPANAEAWKVLQSGGSALDAVEAGARIVEANPEFTSVGNGGLPDRDGHVTLDACIMNHLGDCGAVSFLENIMHPISVARAVMEKTPHVMLSGEGAFQFARVQGFEKTNLLTAESEKAWKKWKAESEYAPIINIENHDTIGLLAQDAAGNLSGACTTSGLAFKMHGRVGDSPIIGAGLFVDNQHGAAVATGLGEVVMKTLGSFLVVEKMRDGLSPGEACELAVKRLTEIEGHKAMQVGYLAINKAGEVGSYALQKGFNYAYTEKGEVAKLIDSQSLY